MNAAVLTVSQVNVFIKSLIEGDGRLQSVVVSGEISNFTDHYRSGHLYFSLKDEKSVLKAVMFASAARRLKFRPQDGMKVLIRAGWPCTSPQASTSSTPRTCSPRASAP